MINAAFGFLLSVALVPGIAGAATSPRWAIAAVSLYFARWWCVPFGAFAIWSVGLDQGVHWLIIACAFCWGLRSDARTFVIVGFGIGVALNGLLAIAQMWGFSGIPQAVAPAGLFLNKNLMGEVAALVLIAALSAHLWPIVVACVPALLLSGSRASWLAVYIGLLPFLRGHARLEWVLGLGIAATAAYVFGFSTIETLQQRVMLWEIAVSDLRFFGSGAFDYSTLNYREPNVHNDFLQMVYQFGAVALVPLAVLAWVLIERPRARPFVITASVIACFGFPMEAPATAWLIAFMLGSVVGDVADERGVLPRSGMAHA